MIQDFNQEGKVALNCLITKADIGRTAKNAPYLSLILEDQSGQLDAKFWNITEEQAVQWKPGMIVTVVGDLIRYRNAWQLRVRSIAPLEGRVTDFLRSAPISRPDLEKGIHSLIDNMKNPIIRQVCQQVLDMKKEDFFEYPAAVRNHHNMPGGLAWHTLNMAKMGEHVIDQYDWLDRDLLMAGILLHDLGKTEEYSAPVLPEYTPAGNLIGHISMVTAMIDRAAVAMGEENSEEVMLLKHLVLSHHGKMEYGSPVLPMIAEAEVLTLLDNLDARMFMIHQMLDTTEPGCFGPRTYALDNRMFYRKTWDDQQGNPLPRAEKKTEAKPEVSDSTPSKDQ